MNAHPGTTNDIDFYISPHGGDGSLPPHHDWLRISESEGLNPAPEVHLRGCPQALFFEHKNTKTHLSHPKKGIIYPFQASAGGL